MVNMRKMYIEPQTEAMPMTAASVLCASGSGNHVTVNNNAQNDLVID